MEPISLKKSCDFCTQSKVKCSGGYPCKRCTTKKIQCFYSPRKKRGTTKKSKRARPDLAAGNVIVTSSGIGDNVPLGSLGDWERRSWSVFFTLYKHYGTSCSLHWFNKQLHKMKTYLEKQGNKESLRRLNSWMEALSIDVDSLADQIAKCHIQCYKMAMQVPLRVDGNVEDTTSGANLLKENQNEKIPFIRLQIGFDPKSNDDVTVDCNKAFSQVFGFSKESISQQLQWTGGGFLPWGGDILSRILTKEADLLAFVQILAIKFNSMGRPQIDSLPYMREVPSCHMFEVKIKENTSSGKLIPVQCLVKCVHREVITAERAYLDINMEFTLMAPHEHLLKDDAGTSKLSIGTPVEAFPVRNNKRSADDMYRQDSLKFVEPPVDVKMEKLPSSKVENLTPAPPIVEEKIATFSQDSEDPFNKALSSTSLLDNIVDSFASEDISYEDPTQENNVADSGQVGDDVYFDPSEDLGDNSAEWFDELLGWAGKQEVQAPTMHPPSFVASS
mmetsp:Transcript_11791/g.13589  ORF Transcript_11791/g.13589 Transcript_11791/m.13589 type:complete len:502 (-) Transcript_11791:94-1599(-)|eukprot:CAMPEP_0184024920 /NCGR_PEP_ID=MMETSP0954-20121128/12442_1 /TAXON_ID=627963 /ORGANISM="Aplanochytrium sp, Strain PBS07" /LENGTH=501 /DNA_ID=CAMNT_0026308485 /DNA_START=2024 /DNA_END=3529 /DNA_ORIENTATION=-